MRIEVCEIATGQAGRPRKTVIQRSSLRWLTAHVDPLRTYTTGEALVDSGLNPENATNPSDRVTWIAAKPRDGDTPGSVEIPITERSDALNTQRVSSATPVTAPQP